MANIFEKTSKRTLGFTVLANDILQVALYQIQPDGGDQFIAKEEFDIKTTSLDDRKRLVHSFLSRAGQKVHFKHLIMRERAFTKHFEFPSKDINEIKQMLALRLPREIPSSVDQIVYHFHPIQSLNHDTPKTAVLLFGVSKELVNQERELLKSFGIQPDQILLSSIVIATFVRKKLGLSGGIPRIVLFGAFGKGEVLLAGDQGIQYSRSFTYDSAELLYSVQESLHPIFESLEPKEDVKSADLCVAGEIHVLKEQLFPGRYPARTNLQPSTDNFSGLDFLFHAGAAIESENLHPFNLLPDEVKQKIAVKQGEIDASKTRFSFAILVVTFLLIALFSSVRMLIAISAVSTKQASIDASVKEVKEIARSIQAISSLKMRKIRPIDLIAKLHEESPGGILLNELEYDDKEEFVRLKGRADEQSLVDQYVRKIGALPWFSRADLQYSESTNEGGRTQFQFSIQAPLKKGFD